MLKLYVGLVAGLAALEMSGSLGMSAAIAALAWAIVVGLGMEVVIGDHAKTKTSNVEYSRRTVQAISGTTRQIEG